MITSCMYNIFKCHFNPFIGRHRIQSQANIVLILFTYYIESAHVAGSLICWSLVYVLTLGPMPSILAQLATFLIWSAGNVMFIMGSHISIVKIIFVYCQLNLKKINSRPCCFLTWGSKTHKLLDGTTFNKSNQDE